MHVQKTVKYATKPLRGAFALVRQHAGTRRAHDVLIRPRAVMPACPSTAAPTEAPIQPTELVEATRGRKRHTPTTRQGRRGARSDATSRISACQSWWLHTSTATYGASARRGRALRRSGRRGARAVAQGTVWPHGFEPQALLPVPTKAASVRQKQALLASRNVGSGD